MRRQDKEKARSDGTPPSPRVLYAVDLLKQMRWSAALAEQREHFKIGRTQAARDLAVADEIIAAELQAQLPTLAMRSLDRLTRLMDRAEAKGDERAAVMAQREITRIAGLAAPEKIEHSGKIGVDQTHNFEDMTPEQLALLAALDKRRAG